MMNDITRRLLYGGLDRDTYHRFRSTIRQYDAHNLTKYLIVTTLAFLVLGLANAITETFEATNTKLYLAAAAAFLVLLLAQRLICRLKGEDSPLHIAGSFLFMAICYAQAIAVTMAHPNLPAVTFIGVLLMLPLIFAQPPIHTIIFQALATAVFCLCVRAHKPPEIIAVDIWNAISFFGISVVAIVIVTPIRISHLAQTELIRELSEQDMLTGLRNRNSFERDCPKLAKQPQRPVCVYADANGLHELNNERGHEAGDMMLKAVADLLKESFGTRYTYRVGGDEFAAFTFDHDLKQVQAIMDSLRKSLADRSYSLSMGIAAQELPGEAIDKIIKRAQSSMYEDKHNYYNSAPGRGAR